MKLLIISAMPHHLRDGVVVGWGPTVRELDQLATRFTHVRHLAPLHDRPAPSSDLPYEASNIELVPIPPAGGEGLRGKLDVLRVAPAYIRMIERELREADFVHVRAPANIALIATILLSFRSKPRPRWFKYAGNWSPAGRESGSYALQRWWFRHSWHRGIVTVNGTWEGQQPWVRTFYNPSLDAETVARGRAAAAGKHLEAPIQFLYVGRVETPKGAGRAIEILRRLVARDVDARLDIVGDGPERATFEAAARTAGLEDRVAFLGWKSHHELLACYERAHFSLLPTTASEGWPKVLSEGMAFGAVPIAGAVSSIPQYLRELDIGAAIEADHIDAYVTKIDQYIADPGRWKQESDRAVDAGRLFTFEHYLACIDTMIADVT